MTESDTPDIAACMAEFSISKGQNRKSRSKGNRLLLEMLAADASEILAP